MRTLKITALVVGIGFFLTGILLTVEEIQYMTMIKTDDVLLYTQHNQDVATIKRMRDVLNQWDSCQLCADHCPATMRRAEIQNQMSTK